MYAKRVRRVRSKALCNIRISVRHRFGYAYAGRNASFNGLITYALNNVIYVYILNTALVVVEDNILISSISPWQSRVSCDTRFVCDAFASQDSRSLTLSLCG